MAVITLCNLYLITSQSSHNASSDGLSKWKNFQVSGTSTFILKCNFSDKFWIKFYNIIWWIFKFSLISKLPSSHNNFFVRYSSTNFSSSVWHYDEVWKLCTCWLIYLNAFSFESVLKLGVHPQMAHIFLGIEEGEGIRWNCVRFT